MDKPVQVDYRDQILKLPIDFRDGLVVHHGLEWAKKENIVIVQDPDNDDWWMRAKDHKRRRVIPIYTNSGASFTKLVSGRE